MCKCVRVPEWRKGICRCYQFEWQGKKNCLIYVYKESIDRQKKKMNQREKLYFSLHINGEFSPKEIVLTRTFPGFQFVMGTYGALKCFRSFAKTTEVSRSFLSSQVKPVITDIDSYGIYSIPWEDGSESLRIFPLHYMYIRGIYRH
jgi:hypothetical protein